MTIDTRSDLSEMSIIHNMAKKALPFPEAHEELKDVGFAHEEEFSKAIAENFLDEIGDIINGTINPESCTLEDKAGGDFRADIMCELLGMGEEESSSRVIIENQFGYSDHKHLGQCITYGSNSDTKIVVWICENFKDAHVKALQWLNEHFREKVGFYGLEAKAFDKSNFADGTSRIRFNVRAEPLDDIIDLSNPHMTPMRIKRHEILKKTVEKFNEISTEKQNKKLLPHWDAHEAWATDRMRLYWKYFKSTNKFVVIAKVDRRRKGVDNEETWDKLNNHKEKINKLLPNVEWKIPEERGEVKYSLRVSVSVPSSNLEKITEKESEEVTDKLASDMKKLVDIVKELKL